MAEAIVPGGCDILTQSLTISVVISPSVRVPASPESNAEGVTTVQDITGRALHPGGGHAAGLILFCGVPSVAELIWLPAA